MERYFFERKFFTQIKDFVSFFKNTNKNIKEITVEFKEKNSEKLLDKFKILYDSINDKYHFFKNDEKYLPKNKDVFYNNYKTFSFGVGYHVSDDNLHVDISNLGINLNGKFLGFVQKIKLEADVYNLSPQIEIHIVDSPSNKENIEELKKFPNMKVVVIPYGE